MHRAEHRAEQIARVDAYKAWLNAGMPVGEIPPVPRDCDFVAWRQAQDADRAEQHYTPRHDDCPECGAQRVELVPVTPGRFYCLTCLTATPGPAPLRVGSQLILDQAAIAA